MKRMTYLGDSAYCEYNDAGQFVLTTDNGLGASNIIVLEPEVLVALNEFVRHVGDELAAEQANRDEQPIDTPNNEVQAYEGLGEPEDYNHDRRY